MLNSKLIDKRRIASVGFFLGGAASLLLSDVAFSEAALRSSCYGEISSVDCAWFAANGVVFIRAVWCVDSRLCGGGILQRKNIHDEIIEQVLTLIQEQSLRLTVHQK